MERIGILLSIAALAVLSGCEKEHECDVPCDGGVRMTLMTDGGDLVTKSTMAGVDELNENLIKSIHYYFFDSSSGAYVYDGTQTINKTGSAVFSLSGIDQTKFDSIFSGSREELSVFVVANATSPTGSTTLSAIKATALSSLSGFGEQGSFAMTGEGTLTKTGSGTNLTAETDEIKLKRVASKITLKVTVTNQYTDLYSNVWEPQLDSVQIDFNNLCKNGLVGAAEPAVPVLDDVSLLSTNNDFTVTHGATTTEVSLNVPVYSYPREWENGEDDTPYIYITIPWKWGTVKENTYYKILFPGTSVDPNCWYDITAALDGLGSMTKDGTVDLDNLNINISKVWKDAIPGENNNTDANMAMPRVLAVEQDTYVIYNQDSIVIPFVSSHNCTATVSRTQNSRKGESADYSVSDPGNGRTITFTHNLQNNQSTKPYDYQEWKGTITLTQTGADGLSETINIIQKPALCISNETFGKTSYKTIFVDGQTRQTESPGEKDTYRRVNDGDSSGKGHTIWRVTISTLTGMPGYVLADPRSHTSWVSSYLRNNNGAHVTKTGSTNHLTNYYPSLGGDNDNISPDFIVASGQSGVSGTYMYPEGNGGSNPYSDARLRCATYQEAGYPAGRWRLPTKNEIMYVQKLQTDGIIDETLFYTSGKTGYCCADGKLYAGASAVTGTGSVRCVYDRWYWDNTSIPRLPSDKWETFTWGDQEITW